MTSRKKPGVALRTTGAVGALLVFLATVGSIITTREAGKMEDEPPGREEKPLFEFPPQSHVVVIVSADLEWRAMQGRFRECEKRASPFGEWFTAPIGERANPVLFFHGGWGKIAAAASAQYVIDHCSPSLIVNLGTCGGFQGAVERGTVILVERTVVYDIYEQMGDHDAHIAHYSTEIDLDWCQPPYPHDVIRSLMVSGDRDLVVEELPRLSRDFGAIVGDWESGSIAWVARRNNVRTLILRGVSDLVGSSGGEAYDGNIHVFEQNVERIMDRLIDQLPDWIERSTVP
jgi:adenosylhomocysteine nucleosidase